MLKKILCFRSIATVKPVSTTVQLIFLARYAQIADAATSFLWTTGHPVSVMEPVLTIVAASLDTVDLGQITVIVLVVLISG